MSGILMMAVGNSYGSAPVNTVAPAVTGTATVGQTLTTTDGTWTGAPAPTFTYQWQRTGSNIGGATSSTYVLVAADYANTIRCVVTATNSVAPSGVSANSNSTASVAGNAPANTVAPAVTGTATVGQTLSSTTGTWTGVPTPTYTYQWQRTGSNIGGATSSTYVLVNADAANTIRCVVTATNAVSAVSANSNSTASVAAIVPNAPTIGTATATGQTTATVAYTGSTDNGGATITSYTATSSPGGLTGSLSTSGSGTITVTGLSPSTSYTFTVYATNSAGNSAASSASNSVTTTAATGQIEYTTTGTTAINTNFVAPAGVTSISILCVGSGGGGAGGLAYYNNYAVTPGSSYAIYVGVAQYSSSWVYFVNTSTCSSGSYQNQQSGQVTQPGGLSSGGGAAGYAGGGGNCNVANRAGPAGSGGGGGAAGNYDDGNELNVGGGGGVGVLGQGSSGAGGASFTRTNASGGGGGSSGGTGITTSYSNDLNGGPYPAAYGGAVGVTYDAARGYVTFQNGGVCSGIVRIIWPGTTRSFPSTNTGNL